MKATISDGNTFTDHRGILKYVNEFNPGNFCRFYLITHPCCAVVRAWQGHKIEEKAFYVITGSFTIAVVEPKNFDVLKDDELPAIFNLSEANGKFLRVSGESFTGIKATTKDSTLLVLSSLNVNDSKQDDFRQPSNRWLNWDTIN